MSISFIDYLKYFRNDGFLIPQLEAELPLYRYRGNLEFVADEIENDHIYMSPLSKLNDPFDSSYAMSYEDAYQSREHLTYFYHSAYFLNREPWHKNLAEYIKSLPDNPVTLEEFSNIVSTFASSQGMFVNPLAICKTYYLHCMYMLPQRRCSGKVACFSETWESIPMWSYYANAHKGVCLKYDFKLLDNSNITYKNICSSLQKVWYSEQRYKDDKGMFTPFVKSLQWAHEQEWRLFRESTENYIYIPCLSEIYLGINFDWNNIDRISNAIKKNGRNIELYSLHPKPSTYGFDRIYLTY